MINKDDFELLNIANIPNSKTKVEGLIKKLYNKFYSLKDIRDLEIGEKLGYTYETFRKLLNHACIVGMLNCNNGIYSLSKESQKFIEGKCTFDECINSIIYRNKKISNYNNIIYIIVNIFPPSINIKTFYNIFSYVSKDRVDDSALASTGRNLRSVFALLNMANRITKYKNRIKISNNIEYDTVKALESVFQKDIINMNDVTKYLNIYFTKDVSEKILQCMSTYEYENYIWVKGSLYKNNGEIKNLNNEFITTLMIKEK